MRRPKLPWNVQIPVDDETLKVRTILTNEVVKNRHGDPVEGTNRVVNSKFTKWTFVPIVLLEQFGRPLNQYFLLISCLQLIAIITPVNPLTSWLPLLFILFVSAVKEFLDDLKRHRFDDEVNNRTYTVIRNGVSSKIKSKNICAGDLVYLESDDQCPCDMLLVKSSHAKGLCFVQTSNLDGEIDLKTKRAPTETQQMPLDELVHFKGSIVCSAPNDEIYRFDSQLYLSTNGDSDNPVSLSNVNVLLQGTVTRNVDFMYAIAIYTGSETKLSMNKKAPTEKTTKLDRQMDICVTGIFVSQLIVAACLGVAGSTLVHVGQNNHWYLGGYNDEYEWWRVFIVPLRMLLLMSMMIPISLKVTLDVCKYMYAQWIGWDLDMYDEDSDQNAVATSTAICEDLGQIQYIFSDKTGTLTENVMTFKCCSIGPDIFGNIDTTNDTRNSIHSDVRPSMDYTRSSRHEKILSDTCAGSTTLHDVEGCEHPEGMCSSSTDWVNVVESVPHADVEVVGESVEVEAISVIAENEYAELRARLRGLHPPTVEFLRVLALCNDIVPRRQPRPETYKKRYLMRRESLADLQGEAQSDALVYEGTSPDEEALVDAARWCGVTMLVRTDDSVTIQINEKQEKWQVLRILPFTSVRKRVSVLVRRVGDPTATVWLMTKGADDVMLPRCTSGDVAAARLAVEKFADGGLRTLCIASRSLSPTEYEQWITELKTAESTLSSREIQVQKCYEAVECNLRIIGTSAIEDRLQAEVPYTIAQMRQAGVFVWMVTGDKASTAKQIAHSCNLIHKDEHVLKIVDMNSESEVNEALDYCEHIMNQSRNGQLKRGYLPPRMSMTTLAQLNTIPSTLKSTTSGVHTSTHTLTSKSKCVLADTHSSTSSHTTSISKIPRNSEDQNDDQISLPKLKSKTQLEPDVEYEQARSPTPHTPLTQARIYTNAKESYGTGSDIGSDKSTISTSNLSVDVSVDEDMCVHGSKGENVGYSIIIDGQALSVILEQFPDRLTEVLEHAQSVVACRMTPNQKAQIVSLMKVKNYRTLAVGDGGNDVSMIQAAHVGVAIYGKEGLQAARASDYSIAQFHHLRKLMFVHGHYSYRRSAFLVLYSFHKSVFIVSIQVIYQIFCRVSGTSFFDSLQLTLYNVVMTGLPIMWYMLDKKYAQTVLLANPMLYRNTVQGNAFTPWLLVYWIAKALFQAAMCFFSVILVVGMDTVDYKSSRLFGRDATAMVCYCNAILIQTVNLALETSTFTWINHLLIWGCMPILWAVFYLATFFPIVGDYSLFFAAQSLPSFWALMPLILVGSTLPFVALEQIFTRGMRTDKHVDK
eukprot:CFRG2754T1